MGEKWTRFMDMHSGGGTKEPPYQYIYIQLPEEKARIYFYNRFGHNPERVSCTCCGDDYSISESESLEQATAYQRNCEYDKGKKKYIEKGRYGDGFSDGSGKYLTLPEYIEKDDVLIIKNKDIDLKLCEGEVPEEGYVWV